MLYSSTEFQRPKKQKTITGIYKSELLALEVEVIMIANPKLEHHHVRHVLRTPCCASSWPWELTMGVGVYVIGAGFSNYLLLIVTYTCGRQ